ncbi:hypothetical protein BX600DRAFT_476502 [Xylariales sp. PMI_506]|nr:hypothetical protein BX600DRAFT_476502 [Xylariales sp. PMI_506]
MMPEAKDAERMSSPLATLTEFLRLVSHRQPPLTEAASLIIEHAFHASFRVGGEPRLLDFVDALHNFEELIHRSDGPVVEEYAPPEVEVWVHNDLGAVWVGNVITVDGKAVSTGVNVASFLKIPGEGWKISSVAVAELPVDEALPPVLKEPTGPIVEVIETFFLHLKNQNWEGMEALLSPVMSATHSRPPKPPLSLERQAFFDRLVEITKMFPEGTVLNEKIFDIEARACGNIGFVWMHFVVEMNGKPVSKGANIITLFKIGGGWKICGCQDTGGPYEG